MSTTVLEELDQAALGDFMHKFIGDLAATHHAVTVAVGDRLGVLPTYVGDAARRRDMKETSG
jgi:hypothetical protein